MTFALGITAALAAPLVMTVGFIVWENHWTGSAFALNLFKCNLATIAFAVLVLATSASHKLLEHWKAETVGYLLLSSTIGILIGDWTWLQGLKLLGAKRVILMDSFKPFLAAILGWLILNEELRLTALSGIALTVLGVIMVSWDQHQEPTSKNEEERASEETDVAEPGSSYSANDDAAPELSKFREDDTEEDLHRPDQINDTKHEAQPPESLSACANTAESLSFSLSKLWYGYFLSVLNVGLDTYGAVLIKEYGSELSVWEINLIRFGFAGLVMLFLSLVLHAWSWWRRRMQSSKEDATVRRRNERIETRHESLGEDDTQRDVPSIQPVAWYSLPKLSFSSWCHISGGVLLVTFLTPTLSNYSLFQIALALALTLGSVAPLYALILGYFLQGHTITLCAVLGAMLAVSGIVILAFRGNLPENGMEDEPLS